jgi:DNA invertase Pin-like site-specific DNA recombinase
MRAAIYVRISSDPTGKRAGVERQLADCHKICADRRWTVVEVFDDNDRTAYNTRKERPGFKRMSALIAAGEVDVVVAYHDDRLFRDKLEGELHRALWRDGGAKLITTPRGDYDLADADDSFMASLMTAMAAKESADKSRRLRRMHAELAELGQFHGGPPGYGFDHSPTGLKVNRAEATTIRESARRILAGESARAVAIDLSRRGVPTKRAKGDWTIGTLLNMLASDRVAGLQRDAAGQPIKAKWAAILDRPTHDRLVAVIGARKLGPRESTAKHLLTGFVHCGKCGAPLAVSKSVERSRRYRCQPAGLGGCNGTSIIGEHAEDAVRDWLIEYVNGPKLQRALARQAKLAQKAGDRFETLFDSLTEDRARLADLDDLLADGTFDRAQYKRQATRVKDRIAELERRLAKLTPTTSTARAAGGLTLAKWNKLTGDEKRVMVGSLVERVTIAPAGGQGRGRNPARVLIDEKL